MESKGTYKSVGVVKGRSMTTATMATATRFRQRYDAGEVPARVAHGGGANAIAWRVDPAALDARVYLPLFIDGVRETTHPYRVLAVRGGIELTRACGERALLVSRHLPRELKAERRKRRVQQGLRVGVGGLHAAERGDERGEGESAPERRVEQLFLLRAQ